jgi:hypothetical protein
MYWGVPDGDGHKLARMDLDPNPEAVKFADAVAKSLLGVLEQIEESDALPSPFTSIFNQFCESEIDDTTKDEFWHEIGRWLFLGNPKRVLQHLSEINASAIATLEEGVSEVDRPFFERSKVLVDYVKPKIQDIQDYSVQQAVRRHGELFSQS